VESGLPSDEVTVFFEGDAMLRHDSIEVFECFEVPVDDGLVDVAPEGLGRLQLGSVGVRGIGKSSSGRFSPRTVDETNALRHREAGGGVPAGAVEDEQDDPVAPRARLAGEEREPIVGKTIRRIVS
jgi:hypothetical protein